MYKLDRFYVLTAMHRKLLGSQHCPYHNPVKSIQIGFVIGWAHFNSS